MAKSVHARAREAGFVYVLHFDEQLGGKAAHYIGCTSDPAGRLACHAHGQSSSIMAACHAQGVGFKLGALGRTHRRGMRRIEKQAKAWKQASEFCEVCSQGHVRAIPGTQPQPLEMLPFPIESSGYKQKPKPVTVGLSSGRTPVYVVAAMRELAASEKDALGFIPMGGDKSGITDYLESGNVVLAFAGRDVVGYCLFGMVHEGVVTVQQCVVDDARRGCGIGRRMIASLREKHPNAILKARVREDLEANGFWRAVGFTHEWTDTHQTSGSALNVWKQEPEGGTPKLFAPEQYPEDAA